MDVPYFNDSKMRDLGLSYPEVIAAIRRAFRMRARGKTDIASKVSAAGDHLGFFHAMPQVLGDLAIVKWVSCGAQPTDSYIYSHLLASDAISGAPFGVFDFRWLTSVRTAAVSALSVDLLAADAASTVSVFGCGLEARAHIAAFRTVRPIKKVIAISRSLQGAETFAREMRESGLDAVSLDRVDEQFYGSDIVLSSNPFEIEPQLDAGCLAPGALAVAIDHGQAWLPESWHSFDAIVTDDVLHLKGMKSNLGYAGSLEFYSDLPTLLDNPGLLTWDSAKRLAVIPVGLALSDAAVAELVIRKLKLQPIA